MQRSHGGQPMLAPEGCEPRAESEAGEGLGCAPNGNAIREHLGTVLGEPAPLFLECRPRFSNKRPELRRVVVADAVAELMYDDVAEDRLRHEHKAPVERKRAGASARAPAGSLVADRESRDTDTEAPGLVLDDACDLRARLFAVPPVD